MIGAADYSHTILKYKMVIMYIPRIEKKQTSYVPVLTLPLICHITQIKLYNLSVP